MKAGLALAAQRLVLVAINRVKIKTGMFFPCMPYGQALGLRQRHPLRDERDRAEHLCLLAESPGDHPDRMLA